MMQASVYGRLGRDPQTRQTKNDNTMVTCSIAVDATPGNYDGDAETIWLQVLAFGKAGETLARHSKGDLVSLSGRITQNRWTNQAGEEKTGMTIMADCIMSARSVRSAGRKKSDANQKPGPTEYAMNGGAAGDYDDFNDEIPF